MQNKQQRLEYALERGDGAIPPNLFRGLEELYPEGISLTDIIRLLKLRGIGLSEAAFRSYCQKGLIPQAKRVGESGKKHAGSRGLYPLWTLKRLITIKELLSGPAITMDMLHMPSFRCMSGVNGAVGLVKSVLGAFDQEAFSEQEKGTRVPRDVLKLRLAIKEELRNMVQAGEKAIVLMGQLADLRLGLKPRGASKVKGRRR